MFTHMYMIKGLICLVFACASMITTFKCIVFVHLCMQCVCVCALTCVKYTTMVIRHRALICTQPHPTYCGNVKGRMRSREVLFTECPHLVLSLHPPLCQRTRHRHLRRLT